MAVIIIWGIYIVHLTYRLLNKVDGYTIQQDQSDTFTGTIFSLEAKTSQEQIDLFMRSFV